MIQKQISEVLSHLNPLKTYFCGETLSWINIFSEVKSFSCFIIRLLSVSESLGQASISNVKNPSNWQHSIQVLL